MANNKLSLSNIESAEILGTVTLKFRSLIGECKELASNGYAGAFDQLSEYLKEFDDLNVKGRSAQIKNLDSEAFEFFASTTCPVPSDPEHRSQKDRDRF